jgi:hypothetical protein
MDSWFEFFGIHMNEKGTTCHDFHGFKYQNINISLIFIYLSLSSNYPFWLI